MSIGRPAAVGSNLWLRVRTESTRGKLVKTDFDSDGANDRLLLEMQLDITAELGAVEEERSVIWRSGVAPQLQGCNRRGRIGAAELVLTRWWVLRPPTLIRRDLLVVCVRARGREVPWLVQLIQLASRVRR